MHCTAVGDVEPAGQAYPAVHTPHCKGDVSPVDALYRPAGHGPLHVALYSPGVEPYRPAGHGSHSPVANEL